MCICVPVCVCHPLFLRVLQSTHFNPAGAYGSSYPPYATKLRYDEGRVD